MGRSRPAVETRASHNRVVHPRFYAPAARAGEVVALPPDEAQHLTRVLRLEEGAAVRVFDGRGHEFDAWVDRAGRAGATVRVGGVREAAPEPRVAVTLAQAVLKGDKMDDVVRDAVMMGVGAIQPIVTARAEVTLATLKRGARLERWHRIAVSSAKQCGRAVVPLIAEPCTHRALLDGVSRRTVPAPALMFVEPSASADAITLLDLDAHPPHEVTAIVGPEGGWTPEEIDRSAACRLVTLGPRTLRADAMAVVALSALFTLWKAF